MGLDIENYGAMAKCFKLRNFISLTKAMHITPDYPIRSSTLKEFSLPCDKSHDYTKESAAKHSPTKGILRLNAPKDYVLLCDN